MQQDDEKQSGVVPVAPVVRDKGLPALPRVVIVALVVGVVAFVAGVQLGSEHRTDLPLPSVSPASPSESPSASPSLIASPVTAVPDASEFARTFWPPDVIAGLAGGTTCTNRTVPPGFITGTGSGPTLVRVWATFCPLGGRERATFLDRLINAVRTTAVGSGIPSESWGSSSDDRGMTVFYYPYAHGAFVGSVTLAADAVGDGLDIVITLEERPVP